MVWVKDSKKEISLLYIKIWILNHSLSVKRFLSCLQGKQHPYPYCRFFSLVYKTLQSRIVLSFCLFQNPMLAFSNISSKMFESLSCKSCKCKSKGSQAFLRINKNIRLTLCNVFFSISPARTSFQ